MYLKFPRKEYCVNVTHHITFCELFSLIEETIVNNGQLDGLYCHNPAQSRAKLSTWSGITIRKLPPHHTTCPSTIPFKPGQSRAKLST